MAKEETKNIITKETIEKELKALNKADIRSTMVYIAAMTVFFVPLSIIPIYLFFSVPRKTILLGIGCFLGSFVLLLPVLINLFFLAKVINEARLLKQGDWFVDIDQVRYKTQEIKYRHTSNVLYFYRYERVASGGVNFQLASQDDRFYLVIYKKKKPCVVLHYSQKAYEYHESLRGN